MPKHHWTEAQLNFIRDNAALLKDAELAASLSRVLGVYISAQSARKARHRLGIRKRPGRSVCEIRRADDDETPTRMV